MKSKRIMAIVATVTILFSSQLVPLWASPSSVGSINNGQKVYAPINTIVQQMGGTVQRNEADKFSTFTINGKILRIDDKWSFAEVDGKFIPYETRVLGGFTVPVFKKPIIKDGNVYVPVDFLKSSVGLQLDVKDDKITFNAVGNGNSTTTVATVTVPSTSGTKPTSNVGTGNVETNRPATNPTPTTNTNTTPVVTPKPKPTTPVVVTPKPTPTPVVVTPKPVVVVPKPKPVETAPVYNGSAIKQKLYSIGFFSKGSDMFFNKYGKEGADQYDYVSFGTSSGSVDMGMSIWGSNPEVDQKLRTMFSWILPTKGSTLYSILDNPSCNSQTVNLDGRKVVISVDTSSIHITFGPIK